MNEKEWRKIQVRDEINGAPHDVLEALFGDAIAASFTVGEVRRMRKRASRILWLKFMLGIGKA